MIMDLEDEAKRFFVVGMDSFLNTCGNSYVNAYMQKYLEFAAVYVGYDGITKGSIEDALNCVYKFQDEWISKME